MEFKNHFLYNLLGPQLDFKHKLLNLILITTLLGGFATLIFSVVLKMGVVGNLILSIYLIISFFNLFLANNIKKPTLAAVITTLLFNVVACPIMFFQYGGIHCGITIWMVLGLAAPWFVLEGKYSIIVYIISLLPNVASIVVGFLKPELVHKVDYKTHFFDVSIAVVLVSFITGIIYMFQTREYEKQRKRLQLREETLHSALESAANANRAKTNFLATMSHDIRTPLNAIIGFTRIAEKNSDDLEKVKECLEKTKSSSNYLLGLINDVLDMSRIESEQMKMEIANCNLVDEMYKIQELFAEDVKKKNLNFIIEMTEIKNGIVRCDVLRFKQIITNLLSNAIKYTNEYGSIKIVLKQTSEVINGKASYQLIVKDNGIGMTKEFQKVIFDSYSRDMKNIAPGTQGSGLGMAITRAIVNLMGGKITVDSMLGQGSTFNVYLTFPIVEDEFYEEPKDVIYYFDGKHVLLAEDNELNQEIATAILHEYGITTDIANNGMEAYDLIRDSEPGYYDAILMDIQMPIMNGYEATQAIRELEDEKNRSVPIVAMTAHAFEDDREMALKYGMNGHVAKPIEIPKLMDTLNKILS
ncbi:MAG: response regulator [Treponema sp.]|nr:response regulator [Treponema sp.]